MPKYRRIKRAYPTVDAWLDATGSTQVELAKLLNISQSHLSNILGKHRGCSANLLLRISKITNVPIENIVRYEDVAV